MATPNRFHAAYAREAVDRGVAVVVDKPRSWVEVTRTVTFDKPGTYVVKLTVNGQRDGLVSPPNRTLVRNFKEVRVVVQ